MRDCTAACTRQDREGYYTLARLCGDSVPLYDLIKNQSDTVWLSLLRHRANPATVVSASTAIVVSLLNRICDHEKGIVRIIMQFLGPNVADYDGDRWMMDELLTLTRQLKVKTLTLSNAALIAHLAAPSTCCTLM